MKKSKLVFCFVLLFSLQSCGERDVDAAQTENGRMLRVLFVGNSLTFANQLPEMIARLAKSAGDKLTYDMYAKGGYKLSQHAVDKTLQKKISAETWDVVVLQEQSQLPGLGLSYAKRHIYPHVNALADFVRRANAATMMAFYITMARRDGDAMNARHFPAVATYEGMQTQNDATYLQMASDFRALSVPVGPAWKIVRKMKPAMNLYADAIHPNRVGSYLAACVFYAALFQKSPLGLEYDAGLGREDAKYLQQIAERVVLSSGYRWDFSVR